MQLPHSRQFKRFLSLGIGTTLLILCLNLIPLPSTAQLSSVRNLDPPTSGIPLDKWSREDLALSPSSSHSMQTGEANRSAVELDEQGKTYYQQGQLEPAIAIWKQAATAFAAQGDRSHQAMTLSHLALAYRYLGQWDQANAAIAQSLDLLKQAKQEPTGDRLRVLAEVQTIQGSLLLDQGKTTAALTTWQQAALTFQQVGDKAGVIRSEINQAQALTALGFYQRAAQTLEPAYKVRQTQSIPLQIAILLNYGDALRLNGKLDKAQEALEAGLKLAQALPSPPDVTTALMNLGNIARTRQQLQNGLYTDQTNSATADSLTGMPSHPDHHPSALWYYQQAAATTDPNSKVQALLNQQSLLVEGSSDRQSIDTQQVRNLAGQIQALLDRLPITRTTLYARIQLAHNLLQLKDPTAIDAAIQLLKPTVDQAKNLRDDAAQSYALGYLGQAYEEQQHQGPDARRATTEALNLTTQAFNLARALNAPDISYRWLWQLGRLERDHNRQQALKAYDGAYNTLEKLRQDLAADNPDLRYTFQKQPIEDVYREYVELLLRPADPPTADLDRARDVIQALQIQELRNFLQEPCGVEEPESIDAALSKAGANAALLYPIVLPDRLEVIVKLPGKDPFHRSTPQPEMEILKAIKQFQIDVQEPYTFDEVKREGQQIYQWLMAPIQSELATAQVTTLVFALDGPLRNIPLSALYDGQHYLIEKYAVSAVLGLELKNRRSLDKNHLNVLAASLTDPPPAFQSNFGRLTQVNRELDEIKKTGVNFVEKRDLDFTRDAFNGAINNAAFQIVHLATHGQFSSNPQETFIMTAASPGSEGQIRLNDFEQLFRTRVLNRADRIELLILSACETASGDDRAALGIAGTAVRAGAQSAIASLWSLNDASSLMFTQTFYKKLLESGVTKAAALQAAKKALIATDQYSHPRYWAPYVLIGNWL